MRDFPVRLTADEVQILRFLAAREGLPVGAFVRLLLLKEAERVVGQAAERFCGKGDADGRK